MESSHNHVYLLIYNFWKTSHTYQIGWGTINSLLLVDSTEVDKGWGTSARSNSNFYLLVDLTEVKSTSLVFKRNNRSMRRLTHYS